MNSRASLIILSLGAAVVAAASQYPTEYVAGEVLVKARPGAELTLDLAIDQMGGVEIERLPKLDISRIRIPSDMSVRQAVDHFKRFSWVEFAEPNGIWHATLIPNDTSWNNQYGPRQIQCPAAWDITIGSPSIISAIIDTGIQLTHPDLNDKLVPGTGFVDNNTGNDNNGHGSHVAGITSAETNNSQGIAGVGWSTLLQPVKVLNSGGSGSWTAVANGIRWAADNGAKTMNLSLGGTSDGGATLSAVQYAWSRNTVIVCAAGNNGSSGAFYPAFYTECIAVAATNSADNRASFSNFGSWVDVAAPGDSIYSTYLNSTYATLSGTSMASPHVCGLASLLWSMLPNTTNTQIRALIEDYTDNIGRYGIRLGRVNAFRSVQAAQALQGYQIYPESIRMTKGASFTGDFNSVRNSDDGYFVINQRPPFVLSDPSAQWEAVTTTRGGTVSNIILKVEAASTGTPTNRVRVRIQLFNNQTNLWEQVDERDSTTGDTVTTVNIPNAGRFVNGSNQILTRMSWFDLGTISPNWNSRTDQIEWTIQ